MHADNETEILPSEDWQLLPSEDDTDWMHYFGDLYDLGGYRVFDKHTTDNVLRHSTTIKLTHQAKDLFARSMSSTAEEIMDSVLLRTKHITTEQLSQTFDDLDLPFQLSEKHVSITRLLRKYRAFETFTISNSAKKTLQSTIYNIMNGVALSIHMCRNRKRKTVTVDDVGRITDWIVVVRNYEDKRIHSRSTHAKMRQRKRNGRF